MNAKLICLTIPMCKEAFVGVIVASQMIRASDVEKLLIQSAINRYDIPMAVVDVSLEDFTEPNEILSDVVKRALDEANYVAPSNDIESALEVIWKAQLGLEKVSVDLSFFDLGGDSLAAGKLMGNIRKKLKTQVQVSDLYELQTIQALAAKIQQLKSASLSVSAEEGGGGAGGETASPLARSRSSLSLFSARTFSKLPTNRSYSYVDLEGEGDDDVDADEEGDKNVKLHKLTSGGFPLGVKDANNDSSSFSSLSRDEEDDENTVDMDVTNMLSSTSFNALFVQIIPFVLVYPFKLIFSFFIVAYSWLFFLLFVFGQANRFWALIFALAVAPGEHVATLLEFDHFNCLFLFLGISSMISPFFGILIKWLVIGRYKPGRYPLFGTM